MNLGRKAQPFCVGWQPGATHATSLEAANLEKDKGKDAATEFVICQKVSKVDPES